MTLHPLTSKGGAFVSKLGLAFNKRHTASAVCLLFLCGGAEDWPSAAPNSVRNYRRLAKQDAKVREFDPPKISCNFDTGLRLFPFYGIM